MINNKVIVATIFNRPGYTKQCFDALSQCDGIEEYSLIVHQDWDSDRWEKECKEVQQIVLDFALERRVKSFDYLISNPKRGIDECKLYALPKGFEKSDGVVLVEDDVALGLDALRFFEWGFEEFKDNQEITSINTYNRIIDKDVNDLDIYAYCITSGFSCWGALLFKDRYEKHIGLDGEKYRQAVTDIWGANEINGRFDWLHSVLPNVKAVYPLVARCQNRGHNNAANPKTEEWFLDHQFNRFGIWDREIEKGPKIWHLNND